MDHTLLLIEDMIHGSTMQAGEDVLRQIFSQRLMLHLENREPRIVELGPTAMRGLLRWARHYQAADETLGDLETVFDCRIRRVAHETVTVLDADAPTWEPK